MARILAREYDEWYRRPRGQWIGHLEYQLLLSHLKPSTEETVLDVGCGTGYFTRYLAGEQKAAVVGVDPDSNVIEYARLHAANRETYLVAGSEALPYPSRSFDISVSVTTLCFVEDQMRFLDCLPSGNTCYLTANIALVRRNLCSQAHAVWQPFNPRTR